MKKRRGIASHRGGGRLLLLKLLLLVTVLFLLVPIVMIAYYSLFSPREIKEYLLLLGNLPLDSWIPILLVPKAASLNQYLEILLRNQEILYRFFLSLFYAVTILLGQAVFIPSLAYALSAFRFRGRDAIFLSLILLMLLPFQITMVPNMLMLRALNLLDTVWAVILPMWFAPLYVFLIRQYMLTIPNEFYEASQLDGAGACSCYLYITLPICKPIIGTVITLSFVDTWNMVEQPLVFLSHQESLQQLSVIFSQLITNPVGTEFASATLYMLPALFVYLFFQDDIDSAIQLVDVK